MKKVLVTGGTGNLGRVLLNLLVKNKWEISVLTSNDELPNFDTIKFIKGDLTMKESLIGLKNEFNTIVHCASNALDSDLVDVKGTQNLLDTLSHDKIGHFIYISIVGVDKSPYKYYQNKTHVENLIKGSGIPFTIIRATQFHDLVLQRIIKPIGHGKGSKLLVPKDLRFQSIDKREIAQRIYEAIQKDPLNKIINVGGPEILPLDKMLRIYHTLLKHEIEIEFTLPTNDFQKIFTTGINLCPDDRYGAITWNDYLKNALMDGHDQ